MVRQVTMKFEVTMKFDCGEHLILFVQVLIYKKVCRVGFKVCMTSLAKVSDLKMVSKLPPPPSHTYVYTPPCTRPTLSLRAGPLSLMMLFNTTQAPLELCGCLSSSPSNRTVTSGHRFSLGNFLHSTCTCEQEIKSRIPNMPELKHHLGQIVHKGVQ